MGHYVPDLDDGLIREACRHTHPFWGRGRSLEEHTERAFSQMLAGGPELIRYVGWVGESGELLCSLKRYALLLAVPPRGPRVVRTVGIGSVFTAEPYRSQGAATRLLQAVMEEARALGEEAALLYSDIDPAYYARLGYIEYPSIDLSASTSDLPPDHALATRPAGPEDDARLLDWYEASYPATSLRPARNAALWRFFRWRNTAAPDQILSDDGRDVGYIHAIPTADTLWVEEWAAPGVDPPCLWATVRALADEAGVRRIAGWLRRDQVDARFAPARRPKAIPMVADLTGQLALETVDPEQTHFSSLDHF